ncbi:MAG: type II secretion system protein [Patescibacteria group bacterium]
MKSNFIKTARAFTLIEILVVIGIIAVLAAIVIIAINPARQFAQARDSQRTANLNSILNAVGQRIADNKGVFAGVAADGSICPTLPASATEISTTSPASAETSAKLGCLTPTYIPELPADPNGGSGPGLIGYKIYQDTNGRVHLLADTPETAIPRTTAIEITR